MADKKPLTVMLVAGEASGDRHAANMFLELKKRVPEVLGVGMGGLKMAEAGIDVRYDSSHIAVIGLVEVIRHYREIKQALSQMKQIIAKGRPDLLICVDYKEFNYKLASYAKKCGIKVLFYVSPQVWAWRPGRVIKYGKVIDMMAVIFPFETAYYEEHNIPVRYVGHPSVDKVHPDYSREEDFDRFQLNRDYPVVGLLPGSRRLEIKRMLPVMMESAQCVLEKVPETQFVLPQADSITDELLQPYLSKSSVGIKVIKNQPYDVIQCCDAVMTTSGTATLEVALLNIPMVITYKLSPMTYWLGKWLVKSRYIGLPNIIAGKRIIKELIQHQATARNLSKEIVRILTDQAYRQEMRRMLTAVSEELGHGGGSKVMAEIAEKMLLR